MIVEARRFAQELLAVEPRDPPSELPGQPDLFTTLRWMQVDAVQTAETVTAKTCAQRRA